MSLLDFLAGGNATIRANVQIGDFPIPMRPDVESKLQRVVVDTHLHLPDMFELTFLDEEGNVAADAGLDIGTKVDIAGGAPTDTSGTSLIIGEVTSIEAICAQLHVYTVVRGYEKAHRLQRAPRTRTFVNMTDSNIARRIAKDADIKIGTIEDSNTTHTHIAQVSQTDWDFLKQRAREIGFETGVAGGKFFFRKASGSPAGGGGLLGDLASAATSLIPGMGPPTLTFKDNLLEFLPRISAANLTPKVEVRVWDPGTAEVVTGSAPAGKATAKIDGQDPAELATQFNPSFSFPGLPKIPGLPSLGNAPDSTAYVVVNRPVAEGGSASAAAEEMAKGVAEHIGSTFAEAEGYAVGNPKVQAGAKVKVAGVPARFAGEWIVTNAKHTFDEHEGGYHTRFYVSGRQERSLLGLTSMGASQGEPPRIHGVVCGVVTNNNDSKKKGRVKVALPWLSSHYESDWARVVQFGAGKKSGAMFLPEVGDEVLVAFEFGDPRRPYVIGGVINNDSDYTLGGEAVKAIGPQASVVRRGIATPTGNHLMFSDEKLPGAPLPSASMVELGDADGKLLLRIDKKGNEITLKCEPMPGPGTLRIECGQAGTVEIKAGAGGSVNIDGGATLSLKAQGSLKIESGGMVEIKGTQIKLN